MNSLPAFARRQQDDVCKCGASAWVGFYRLPLDSTLLPVINPSSPRHAVVIIG